MTKRTSETVRFDATRSRFQVEQNTAAANDTNPSVHRSALAGYLLCSPAKVVDKSDDHPVLDAWHEEVENRACAGIEVAVHVG